MDIQQTKAHSQAYSGIKSIVNHSRQFPITPNALKNLFTFNLSSLVGTCVPNYLPFTLIIKRLSYKT